LLLLLAPAVLGCWLAGSPLPAACAQDVDPFCCCCCCCCEDVACDGGGCWDGGWPDCALLPLFVLPASHNKNLHALITGNKFAQWYNAWLLFRRCQVQILDRIRAILSEHFHSFTQSLQANDIIR
jgi:hypothetical protein